MGYLGYKIRSHQAYGETEELIASILLRANLGNKFVRHWAPLLTTKLYDVYQRSAANDFVNTMVERMKGLRNGSERLQFRIQILTEHIQTSSD